MELIIKRKLFNRLLIFLLMFVFLFASEQIVDDSQSNELRASSQKYTKNVDGRIMISVNLWGEINSPGRHTVPEGVDLVTILSIVGGPIDGANMSKIKIIRDSENSNKIYTINLNKFINAGDKTDFIKIEPNDTIIIPETVYSSIFKRLSSINTILSLLTLYFTLVNNS